MTVYVCIVCVAKTGTATAQLICISFIFAGVKSRFSQDVVHMLTAKLAAA